MSQELLKLIYEYQLHVLGFVQAIRTKFGVENLLAAVRSNDLPELGSLDDRYETRFHFHGCGCHFESDRGKIDFDFGPDGRHDGFDGWRLWILAQSLPQDYPNLQRLAVVESLLGELVTDGLVTRPRWVPSPHLCYFKEKAGVQ